MSLRALALVLLLGSTCAIGPSSALGAASGAPIMPSTHPTNVVNTAAARAAAHTPPPAQGAHSAAGLTNPAAAQSGVAGSAQSGSSNQAQSQAQPQPQPSSGIGTALQTTAAVGEQPDWLMEINRYRVAAGLTPVSDQPAWDSGIFAHLTYAAKTPHNDIVGQYASLHTENPSSAYYTDAGALEGSRSDLYFGASETDPVAFIDGWFSAPFHAIGMLRARLTQVAFAAHGDAAGLDVIGGLDNDHPGASGPILLPANGMTTNLTTYSGAESPNPIETCGWSDSGTYGLPLIAMLPNAPKANLTARVSGPGGTQSSAAGNLCVVDENTYRSTDEVYGPTGLQILHNDHAVLLIAKRVYGSGQYTATISQPGQADIKWSFTVTH